MKAFDEEGMAIPIEIIQEFEIVQFMQHSSITVMSVLGEIYHWTISCGFNIAKSMNFFTTAARDTLQALEKMWMGFKRSGKARN